MPKLNQVIAVEKGIKTRVQSEVDKLDKVIQKPSLFDGFTKTYKRKSEEEEQVPAQHQKVQFLAEEVLKTISGSLEEMFDVTAQKDYANCTAKSDVVVEGETLLKDVPTTFLLFLEKQLTDLHTLVGRFPVLDSAEDWSFDSVGNVFKTEPQETTRTKKIPRAIVLYPATKEHPAQTQLVPDDIVVGAYEHVKMSGALPEERRRHLVAKIEKLQKAVKFAREHANTTDAPAQAAGQKILGWVFNGTKAKS